MKRDLNGVKKNKYVSLFCIILSVLMICNFTQVFSDPLLIWAENTNNKDTLIYSCDTYDLEYTVVDNEVIILGHNNTLNNDNLVDLEIPSIINGINVVAIGENAFKNCTNIKTITFPSTVKIIGKEAFRGCIGLDSNTELNLGNISILMGDCFSDCTSLQKIYLPKDLYCNSSGSFKNCDSLYDIRFEEGITKIPDYLFDGCTGIKALNSINLEDTARELPITNIPNTIKEIGDSAFTNCVNLEYIGIIISYFKYSCTYLENNSSNFSESSSYSTNDDFNIVALNYQLNNYVYNVAYKYKIDNTFNFIETIGNNAFSGCSKLSHLTFPQTLKKIGNTAFNECSNLKIEFENETTRFNIEWKDDSFVNTNNDVQKLFEFIETSSIEYDKDVSNELLYYNIKYKLNDVINTDNINNLVMYILVPKSLDVIIEKTLLDGNPISTKVSLSKANEVIINLNNITFKEGIIQIAVKPSKGSSNNDSISGYIKFNYNQNSHKCYLNSYLLTENRVNLYTNNKTTNSFVTVNGVVNANNLSNGYVDIYVNKKFVSQAIIDSYGTFQCDIDLSFTEEESTSTIYAKYNNIKSNSLEIKYTKEPVSYIKSIVLNLSGKDHDITNSFVYGTSPLFTTIPSAKYYFALDIANSELLSSVIVTSTKNGEVKYFNANYDSATKKWYTFSTTIGEYLPGELNINLIYKDNISPYNDYSLKADVVNLIDIPIATEDLVDQLTKTIEKDGIDISINKSMLEEYRTENSIYTKIILNVDNEHELNATSQMTDYISSINNNLSENDIDSLFGTELNAEKINELKQVSYLDILSEPERYGFIKIQLDNGQFALGKTISTTKNFNEMTNIINNGYIKGINTMGQYLVNYCEFSEEQKCEIIGKNITPTNEELANYIDNNIDNIDNMDKLTLCYEFFNNLMSTTFDLTSFSTLTPFNEENDNTTFENCINVFMADVVSPIITSFDEFKYTSLFNAFNTIPSPIKYTDFMGHLGVVVGGFDFIDRFVGIVNNDDLNIMSKVGWNILNVANFVGTIWLCEFAGGLLPDVMLSVLPVFGITTPWVIAVSAMALLILLCWESSQIGDLLNEKAYSNAIPRWSVDPSGIVYEINHDNINDKTKVLENVPVTLFYKNNIKDNEYDKWNASEYEQLNPLYTDEQGKFCWDTPEGCYQVVCNYDGYCTIKSPWFIVPPEKTDLRIGMIKPEFFITSNNKEFSVEKITVDNNAINIQFNNYVEMSNLAKYITLTDEIGNLFNYNISYSDYLYELGSNSYTKQITISTDSIENVDKLTLTISNKLQNYSNIPLEQSYTKIIYFEDGQLSGHTYQNAIISLNHEKELYNLPINLNIKVIAKDEDNNILSTDIYCYDDLQVYRDDTLQKIFKIPQFDNAVYSIELYNNDFLITTIGDSELSKNDTNYNGKLDKWINLFDKTIIDKETHTQIPYQLIFTPAIEEIPITINLSTYVDGDVDLDGNLTAHDELFLKKYVLGLYNIIQTGSTDGITINKNGGNCNNIAINGDISTNGHLTFLSWNGNINGELNSIEEPIISSNINHKEVGNIPFDTEQLLTKEQVEELYFNSPIYKTDYKDETQNINLTKNIIDSNMIVLGNQENINSNITLNSSIMAENDINIKGQVQNSQDSVIYSVNGNITIEASTISYVGIIYAPNGKVTLSGTNVNINGTVIAKEIEINADSVNFNIIQFNTDSTKSLSRFQLFLANIFYDDKVNIVDLVVMKKKILGII